ncbi:hypothetical protein A28LD_0614, partial [Idiomarina sp. A28L]|uniref:hypothetical protein n=1 Tax=Idiomarina sp. A28L TaxID=1036674 RepID=UPI0002138E2B
MLNENIQQATIGGIKRLANQLKKSNGLPYHEALNIAARSASFENYAHASNQLENSHIKNHTHRLFFTSYWYDIKKRKMGREVLDIELSKPLLKIINKNEYKRAIGMAAFRLASPNHFVNDDVAQSQEGSIDVICKAVRMLRLIEATGLKPNINHHQSYPNESYQNKLPQADHSSHWYDPVTGQSVLIDEPYLTAVIHGERAEWAKMHNWHLQASTWPGMYYPDMSYFFVATDATTGFDLKGLMDKINSIPNPLSSES